MSVETILCGTRVVDSLAMIDAWVATKKAVARSLRISEARQVISKVVTATTLAFSWVCVSVMRAVQASRSGCSSVLCSVTFETLSSNLTQAERGMKVGSSIFESWFFL